jgi:hypothetical protein
VGLQQCADGLAVARGRLDLEFFSIRMLLSHRVNIPLLLISTNTGKKVHFPAKFFKKVVE